MAAKPSRKPNPKGSTTPIKGSSKERPRTNPTLFIEGETVPLTSSLPLWEASNVLTQRKHLPWVMDPDGKLCYTRDVDDGQGAIYFWVADNTEEEHPATLAGAAALAVIDNFDIRAACMHLIYAAHATQVDRPWEEEIVIDDRQIEAYLGLQKRTDKSRKEKLALIEEIAKQPSKITTYISWPQQGRRKGFTVEEGRLWHILGTRYHYQQDLFGNKEIAGISFIVKAGLWAKYFLNEENETERNAIQQSALPKSLLESIMSIWQHREGAARLMVWLLFKSQTHNHQALSVQTLMEVAYGPKKVEEAKSDLQLRKKLANTWDEDVFSLHDRGWQLKFDPTSYPEDIQPIGLGRGDTRRPRGFFEKLLDAYIWISPPENWVAQKLAGNSGQASDINLLQTIDEPEQAELTGEDVKAFRQEKGWSQRKLATLTGMSQGLISMIENGSRSITPDNEMVLRRVFDYL
ncbi:helix-turn-helix transcriptional regulator [Oscillatoria sp. CS-180]|uniref:helix-turn-helix domain-containing protein n=1 Tax=Oscillatoria sp. CS-180 TaxID=3021720 RepID=UPI0023300EEC|nr:helix-turn-helix transcriptional regulator [Oscillatoria sp. CS-180]MDB9527148.1 helix-turn-helix transcriptional regulator [Oscillatoria sp. CS-180]